MPVSTEASHGERSDRSKVLSGRPRNQCSGGAELTPVRPSLGMLYFINYPPGLRHANKAPSMLHARCAILGSPCPSSCCGKQGATPDAGAFNPRPASFWVSLPLPGLLSQAITNVHCAHLMTLPRRGRRWASANREHKALPGRGRGVESGANYTRWYWTSYRALPSPRVHQRSKKVDHGQDGAGLSQRSLGLRSLVM
jgi:hypothetical protein